jgi:nitroreductase
VPQLVQGRAPGRGLEQVLGLAAKAHIPANLAHAITRTKADQTLARLVITAVRGIDALIPTICKSSIHGLPSVVAWVTKRSPASHRQLRAREDPFSAEGRACFGGGSGCRCDQRDKGVHLMVTASGLPTQSAVDQVLSTTRCVRKGLDTTREVPREQIEDCLRIAMQAPIGSNGLYPHFIVVTDPVKRAAVAGFYKQAWDAYLPLPFSAANLHFEDPVHEAQQPRVTSSAAYLAEHMADVPVLVIPCITPRVDGMPMWVQACIWGSVLPQSWSFMLAARARGLASAWTQIHIQFEEEVAAVLGINHAEVQQAALIAVAYPHREDFKPAYREPVQKFTHWDSW